MDRGFMLSFDKADFQDIDDYYYFIDVGSTDIFMEDDKHVEKCIDEYITGAKIDGTAIQDDWFPQIKKCDIFISHSHKDEKLAIALAGWLSETFGLKAFVDSSIWGYADDLINKLLKETDDNYYPHNERNNSDLIYITSHVHNMLNVALMNMIEKSKCLFFLNTPNSTILDGIKTYTLSPWIYTELEVSKILSQRPKQISDSRNFNFAYDVDLSHLTEINSSILNRWQKLYKNKGHALETLYNLTNQRKNAR